MKLRFLALGMFAAGATMQAVAVEFVWTGTSNATGVLLKAKAEFTAVGSILTIKLTNDSAGPSTAPADLLATLSWNMGNTFDTPNSGNSAAVGPSMVVSNNAAYSGSYNLNKEYMYEDGFSFAGNSFAHGVSAVGLSIFGTNEDTFYERMRGQGNAGSSAGPAFTISSAFGTTGAANNTPVVKNSVTFTLISDLPIDLASITKVAFGFGSDARTTGVVPEPASAAILAVGAAILLRRRSK